jgi:hypothetical protein
MATYHAYGKSPNVPSNELVRRWRKRQLAILKTIIKKLPPDLLTEFRSLSKLIKKVREEEQKIAHEKEGQVIAKTPSGGMVLRVPMSFHKRTLIEFLNNARLATRAQILESTTIPEGSLSELLRDPEFVQAERGVWRLKDWPRKPPE